MKHNVSGTRFSEAGILTWSPGFFNFSKVKNGVSELWRTKAQIGFRGAKSTQLTTPVAVTTNHHSHAHNGHRRHAHSGHAVTLTTATAVTLTPSITVSVGTCINETWLRRQGMSGCAC